MPRPFADFYFPGTELEKGLYCSTDNRGMRIDDSIVLVLHEIWFQEYSLSCDLKTETLYPVKNHGCEFAVVSGRLQNRHARLTGLSIASLLPARFPFCATGQ